MRPFSFVASLKLFGIGLLAFFCPAKDVAAQSVPAHFPSAVSVGQSSAAIAVTLTFSGSGVAGPATVVTEGVSPADFSIASVGTCTAGSTYTAGQACTVQVSFAPRFPGRRNGAIVLKSTDGHLLASTLLTGQATGPLPRLSPGRIDTVAGDRSWVFAGDGVSAVGAPIFLPQGLTVDAAGNLFLSDSGNSRIRRVDAATGTISTVLGTGVPGYTPDGGQGTSTAINQPAGLALDGAGNLYFADSGNGVVRRLDAVSGQVSTVAGTPGVQAYTGDGGLAISSALALPEGIALDSDGNLLIADTGNNVLREVDAGTLRIRTIAGTGAAGFSGDGGLATNARLNSPWSLVSAADGSILFADFSNDRVRRISPAGTISTVVGTGVRGFGGDGGSPLQAELDEPTALALDPAGEIYIADSGNNRVRMVSTAGVIQTLAGNSGDSFSGDGGPSDQASLYGPYAMFFDASANLFVADLFHNRVRRISGQNITLNFPTIRVSKKSAPQPQGLANAGNDAFTPGAPTLLDAALDSATSTCLSASVPAGGLCSLGVEFAPTSIGTLIQGAVTVNSNSAGIMPVIAVQGQVLSVEPTSTALAASANPALIGSVLTLTATVSSDDSSRSGDVTFLDGQAVICTAALNASGKASCSTSSLTLGVHAVAASYAGDANNASSTSAALNVVIKDAPQLVLEVTPNPVTVTQPVQFKLTTSGPDGVPTGTISFFDGANVLATAVLNNAGVAILSNSQLAPGTHVLSAQYAGDSTYAEAASTVVNAVVNQASTSTAVSSSNAAISVGGAVTLAAQVSSLSGPIPTGTVTFTEGSTVLGSAALDANSRATLTLSTLLPGTHTITAAYGGDANNAASTSAAFQQVVEQITTLTSLIASANPLSAGATLHLSAAVVLTPAATASGALSGTVTFKDGTAVLGTDVLDPSGHAVLSVPGLAVGAHSITAVYSGNVNYGASVAAAVAETVSMTSSAVSVTASASSSLAGKPVDFNVSVSSSTGIPSGTVALQDGPSTVAQATLTASGTASFHISSLATGSHLLTVAYAGDANYAASSSSALSLTVNLAQTSLALSGPSTPVDAGTSISFAGAISSNGLTPSGTVTLRDGAVTLATQALGASGNLVFSADSLSLGTHLLNLLYGGDADNSPATSNTLNVEVRQAASITVLSGASRVTQGSSLVLTATVSSNSPHLGGTVSFQDGSNVLGVAPLAVDGSASLSTSVLPSGLHAVTAAYSGDTNHLPSAAPSIEVRIVRPSGAILRSSNNPSISGTPVTLTATIVQVNPAGSGAIPSGVVTFMDGGNSLGNTTLDANGAASITSSTLSIGTHALTLSYAGDTNFAAASASLSQAITNASTQVSLSASVNPGTYAGPLTFTAVVMSDGGAATGSVVFREGTAELGSAVLGSDATARLTLSTLAPGAHVITADYTGDGRANQSVSAPFAVTVKQTTSLALTSSFNPALTLSPVQLTATVSNGGAAQATGTVFFTEGATPLGSASLDAGGHAALMLPNMSAGTHPIVASYAGDDKNFAAPQSVALSQVVERRSTTTALTSSATNTSDPQQVTLIALVHGDGSVPPSGTVTFQSGGTLVGTSPVDATGVATLTVRLESASETISASYGGDASYSASSSASASITAGDATQFTLQVDPLTVSVATKEHVAMNLTLHSIKGFNDTLKLGCLGLPFAATCTFATPETKLTADGSATVQLVLDTGNPLGAGAQAKTEPIAGRRILFCSLPCALLFMFGRRQKKLLQASRLLLLLVAFMASMAMAGCGGLQMNGTAPGTYTFKVTASGAGTGATQSQTVVLTVTQ